MYNPFRNHHSNFRIHYQYLIILRSKSSVLLCIAQNNCRVSFPMKEELIRFLILVKSDQIMKFLSLIWLNFLIDARDSAVAHQDFLKKISGFFIALLHIAFALSIFSIQLHLFSAELMNSMVYL